MNNQYDLSYLEKTWVERKLDLFPYIEGFYSLLRSREANLEKTRKKLQAASPATLVQFLSSDDPEVSQIACSLIQTYSDQDLIAAILLYSLAKVAKVAKESYPARVGTCMAGSSKPIVGLHCLFRFFHQLPEIKEKIHQTFQSYWQAKTETIFDPDHLQRFFGLIFQAIKESLKRYIPDLKRISSLSAFLLLKEDLTLPLAAYYSAEMRYEIKIAFDQELRNLGQEIGSLQKLIFPDGHLQNQEALALVLSFIGLLRLTKDREVLEQILANISNVSSISPANISKSQQTYLITIIEKVIPLLEDQTVCACEILPSHVFLD